MAKVVDKAKNMLSSLGAVQTLVENFPMSLISFDGLNFSASFDVLRILFKWLGIDREEIIDVITDALVGGAANAEDGTGFIATAEEIVKIALETNIVKVLNCSTNPIITNNLLDKYTDAFGNEKSGEGIILPFGSLDYMGYLKHNPCDEQGKNFYFDVDGRTPKTMYASKDFNAYLWYIIHKGDDTQVVPDEQGIAPVIWDNRYRAGMYKKKKTHKDIIKCTYIDEAYPMTDKLKVQLCGSNYFNTRKISIKNQKFSVNKTIFEFNHEFLTSIRLYDPKVIVTEIADHLLYGSLSVNINYSVEERILKEKIEQMINKIIKEYDSEVEDCYFQFSNEEYNNMLEEMERKRYNAIRGAKDSDLETFFTTGDEILEDLKGISSNSKLIDNKSKIKETFNDLTVTPAQDEESEISDKLSYDWQFELIRMIAFPFIRPIFTPKVMLLLMINKQLMGGIDDYENFDFNIEFEKLVNSLYFIIKDIVIQLVNMIMDIFWNLIMEKLRPLLELFASKLLMETIQSYKDILIQCYEACAIGWDNNGKGSIDNVNYADIIEPKKSPDDKIC